MALPAVDINWGSDTNFSSGPESGTAVKVDPGSPALAQGFVPDNAFMGPHANYALYWITQHCKYLRGLGSDAFFLAITFVWTALHNFTAGLRAPTLQLEHSFGSGGVVTYTTAGVATAKPCSKMLDLVFMPANGTAGLQIAGAGNAYSAASVDAVKYIELPTGCILTSVSIGCRPVVSGACTMLVQREEINTSSGVITLTTLGSLQTSSGTAHQTLSTSFSESIANAGRRYRIYFTTGAANHEVSYVSISFSDPGTIKHD